jgi:hypothetical protein
MKLPIRLPPLSKNKKQTVTTDLKKLRVRKFIDEEDGVKMELRLTNLRPSQSTESETPVKIR